MDGTFRRLAGAVAALGALGAGCTYDPPPDVRMVAPAGNRFLLGDPVVLEFTEPVAAASLVVRVWPGRKDLYDQEGERLPGVVPILGDCTPATSPCGAGVALTVADDRRQARLDIPDEALGPLDQPLVLEIAGGLRDDAGRVKETPRSFDFQIVRTGWNPFDDAVIAGDAPGEVVEDRPLDVEVATGPHFFFAQFTSPIEIPQQFWCDVRVDPTTGRFLVLLTDADPVDGAPRNTSDPQQCTVDQGVEGFIFTTVGRLRQASPGADPTFESEPFTLTQNIGPILFELRDMVMRGTVTREDGVSRWDGTIAVREVYYAVEDIEEVYPADQANFGIRQLPLDQVPPVMPRACDLDPCSAVGGRCDLPAGPWPVETFCP